MSGRTIAIGDIHGEIEALHRILDQLPVLDADDTLLFLGDYVDRGPHSKAVISLLMDLPRTVTAKLVFLRGNHEDAWLRVRKEGWDEFVLPPVHGCLATLRSYVDDTEPPSASPATNGEMGRLTMADFFPEEVIAWLEALPLWYEDPHGIYVHAGLPRGPAGFLHPAKATPPGFVTWVRTDDFIRNYDGKRVIFGHTPVDLLPPELSTYTPDDPDDIWESEHAFGLDTGSGMGGFLTAIELPAMTVYESRAKGATGRVKPSRR